MHIVVCLKRVYNPEIPAKYFKIDPETNRPVAEFEDMVIDSYAENALETAIQLKEQLGEANVTAICVGDEDSEEVLRQAYAFTADQAVRVWDASWTDLDGKAVGHILAATINFLGGADIVLTGYQASDIEEGLVGPVIAEELTLPCVTAVSKLDVDQDQLQATQDTESGPQQVTLKTPAVVTITSSEVNVPRLPKIKDVRQSRRKPILVLTTGELTLDQACIQPSVQLKQITIPNQEVACDILQGETGADLAEELIQRLTKLNIV